MHVRTISYGDAILNDEEKGTAEQPALQVHFQKSHSYLTCLLATHLCQSFNVPKHWLFPNSYIKLSPYSNIITPKKLSTARFLSRAHITAFAPTEERDEYHEWKTS